jgi:hypothetical protein
VSIRTLALCPAARTWKWGGAWSSKYIVIASPKKRLIVGITDMVKDRSVGKLAVAAVVADSVCALGGRAEAGTAASQRCVWPQL